MSDFYYKFHSSKDMGMSRQYDLKLEVFQGRDGQWYWHIKAGNGRTICQGEGHKRRRVAILAAKNVIDKIRTREVLVYIGDNPEPQERI